MWLGLTGERLGQGLATKATEELRRQHDAAARIFPLAEISQAMRPQAMRPVANSQSGQLSGPETTAPGRRGERLPSGRPHTRDVRAPATRNLSEAPPRPATISPSRLGFKPRRR